MFVDSHCHLDFPELVADINQIFARMDENKVSNALCISVDLKDWPNIVKLIEQHDRLWGTVGVHPDYVETTEPTVEQLVNDAQHPKIVGIGETGLDYYRLQEPLDWQRERFRTHIRAAIETQLPLIIHTRNASEDTLKIMIEEKAHLAGGVMHCFAEEWEWAQKFIDIGFHISLSGIVSFKNAKAIHEVARNIPLAHLLIETDSPYLAPVPFRGKINDPSKVRYVAQAIADLKEIPIEQVAQATSNNFFNLFKKIKV